MEGRWEDLRQGLKKGRRIDRLYKRACIRSSIYFFLLSAPVLEQYV